MVDESITLLKHNDPMQASEKLYKVAEECIKLLAIKNDPKLGKNDYWSSGTLKHQVSVLTKKYGDDLKTAWDAAWFLHTVGFHEDDLTVDEVYDRLDPIKSLIELL